MSLISTIILIMFIASIPLLITFILPIKKTDDSLIIKSMQILKDKERHSKIAVQKAQQRLDEHLESKYLKQ